MTQNIKLESLYGHWVNFNDIWTLVSFSYSNEDKLLPEDLFTLTNLNQQFFRLAVSYGLLYVVIEGYQSIKIKDEDIDLALSNIDFVDKLRLLRNAIFHYQNKPLPEKLMKFILTDGSSEWISDLRKKFELFFISHLPIEELITLSKNK
ncbi:hypothetical protein ACD661_16495 [Legionella lytica]|uniref:Uncharacterized protein n=1 Tax=Legionella lytica TaxID=96232 RepID=A0ABW8DBP8_9GAMM